MKITFLVANLACGGVERTVSYLSNYFAEHGCDTSIVCISDEQFYDIDKKVQLVKLNIPSQCSGFFDRYEKIVLRFLRIHRALKHLNPDCVICLDAELLRFIRVQRSLGRFKLITSERTNPLMNSDKQRMAKFKSYRNSDGVIFQTKRAQKCFPRDIAEKGIVIPNAVGNEMVFRAPKTIVRRKVITAVGRLTEQKDYPTLLRAFALFLERHSDYTLEIYGDGALKSELRELILKLHIETEVELKGAVKDAVLYVSSSSCYVMSSLYEGMPNALMEALAVGTPCVSTDCPFGPYELIKNGENGLLVPVGDAVALCDAMCRMIEDVRFAERCSENAKKILSEQSIEEVSRKYLDYITGITEGN